MTNSLILLFLFANSFSGREKIQLKLYTLAKGCHHDIEESQEFVFLHIRISPLRLSVQLQPFPFHPSPADRTSDDHLDHPSTGGLQFRWPTSPRPTDRSGNHRLRRALNITRPINRTGQDRSSRTPAHRASFSSLVNIAMAGLVEGSL